MTLYKRFFDAATLDLEAAKVLTDRDLYQPAIFHLQQAYEKCIKSYFMYKEMKINNIPEPTVYKSIQTELGHNTEESTISLLKDTADIEKLAYETMLPNIADLQKRNVLQKLLTEINNYKLSLDKMVQKLDLTTNYTNNVRNYSQQVTSRYNYHQNSINGIITKQPDMTFLTVLSCMINLYPCFYRMESITRYPLKEFSYDNLNLLNNQGESCQKIIDMMDDLIRLISIDLKHS